MELLSLFLFLFLALSSSENETIIYLVDGMVVNKKVDEEIDNKVVKQGAFKQILLAKKLVIGFNKLSPLRILIISNL